MTVDVHAPDGSVVGFPDGTPPEVMTAAMRKKFGGPSEPAPRIIQFEGRRIQVPADATDAEVSDILNAGSPAASGTPRAPAAPSMTDMIMDRAGGLLDKPPSTPPQGDDSYLTTAAYLPRGIRSGVAALAGLPVDALNAATGAGANALAGTTNMVLRALGLPEGPSSVPPIQKPFGGSRSIDATLGLPGQAVAAGVNALGGNVQADLPPPKTFAQRLLSRTGQEIGAALLPVGAAVRAGNMGIEAARKLPSLFRMMVEPAAIAPKAFAVKELTAALSAGAGAGAVNQFTEMSGAKPGSFYHNLGDILGAVGGVGATRVVGAVGGPVKNVWGSMTGNTKAADRVIRDGVVDTIANEAGIPNVPGRDTSELADAIMRGNRVDKVIPGYVESLADRTGNPGLAALEYSRSSGPNSGVYTKRSSDNTAAVDAAVNEHAPTGTPGALRSALETERTAKLGAADATAQSARDAAGNAVADVTPQYTPQARGATVRTAVDDALQRFVEETRAAHAAATRGADEAVGRITPQSDPAVRGNVVRSALEDGRDAARARTEDAYSAADTSGRQVDPVELRDSLDNVDRGLTSVERGLVPQATIDRVRALGHVDPPVEGQPPVAPDPIRLKEATDLRSELLRKQRAALADPRAENGGRNAARVIGQYVDSVETFIRDSLSPEQLDALGVARTAKTAEADAFTRAGDPVSSVLARHEGGNPRVRDERVAGAFVSPTSDAPLQRLFTEADSPAVRGAISDEILSKIPAAARTDPDKLDSFLRDYEIPLRQFPGLRDTIAAASTARRGAATAEAAVTARQQEFSGDSRALADVSARRADGTPAVLDEQVAAPFANPAGNRDLDALFNRADTPAVRGAIEDEMLGRAASSTDKPERIQRFIAAHAEPLKRFPGLQARLEKAVAARTAERSAADTADTLSRDLGTPGKENGTSTVGKYLQFGDERAQNALKGVIASKDPAKAADELLNFVGNDAKAVEGGRKAFWDLMQSHARSNGETTKTMGGAQPWMPNKLKNFLDDPATSAVADRLYKDNPEHLARIREIADTLQNVNVRQRAKAPNTSGTGQSAGVLPSMETIASRVFAVERGVVSPAFAGLNILGIIARRATGKQQTAAFQRALDKALTDPDWAAQLLKDNNPANRAALAKGAKGWMGNEADTLMKMISGDGEPEDPTAKAVMRK